MFQCVVIASPACRDVAISGFRVLGDCFASLAMTMCSYVWVVGLCIGICL